MSDNNKNQQAEMPKFDPQPIITEPMTSLIPTLRSRDKLKKNLVAHAMFSNSHIYLNKKGELEKKIVGIQSNNTENLRNNSNCRAEIQEKMNPALISRKRETVLTWVGIVITVLSTVMVATKIGPLAWHDHLAHDRVGLAIHSLIAGIFAILIYGSLVYQFARLAFIRRFKEHINSVSPDHDVLYEGNAPSVSILVPSYKEERAVVKMTLLSAALQDYPEKHVVLLIDDPHRPTSQEDQTQLDVMRRLPAEIEALFTEPRNEIKQAQICFRQRINTALIDLHDEYRQLARLYEDAATWVQKRMDEHPEKDHADLVFADKVLGRHRNSLLQRARELHELSSPERVFDEITTTARQEREYNRLVGLFSVSLSSFERKRYVNLSHESNKAMNLNSYLGLMGKRFSEKEIMGGLVLEEKQDGHLVVPWADYVVTLDADSMLVTDYVQRLVYLMEQPENARVAVFQTPYSAFPGAPGTLERIAGATTDIQYIIHQGFDGFGATYWVGANALLRREALEDIVESELERGYPVKRYIQDRTVIEDTESTIDLVVKGWQLRNYPERLAYSATPPDFGSLLIQRRRWANGGLLILPKLIRHLTGRTKSKPTFAEGFMRLHYLFSIAAVNMGLLIVLGFPITGNIETGWLQLSALPYFFLYGRDLMHLGYRGSDLIRVYALNLLLIPVNLGGVFTSIKQAILKTKIPFGRTPKIQGRTAAPIGYILAEYVLLIYWLTEAICDIAAKRWLHAGFGFMNTLLVAYAIGAFIGFKESILDVCSQLSLRHNKTLLDSPMLLAELTPSSLQACGKQAVKDFSLPQ